MCGILAFLDVQGDLEQTRALAVRQARLLRHRGPDWSGVWTGARAVLAHERLAIVDVVHGAQPLTSPRGDLALAVNGEIYNHRILRDRFDDWAFATDSDCEVILPLYDAGGEGFLDTLRGMFAFVLVDKRTGGWMIARDAMGIIPLYTGRMADGTLVVASEMKALMDVCVHVERFPPGHVMTHHDEAPRRWYTRDWFDADAVLDRPEVSPATIRDALTDAVHGHLMGDVPYGVLLSGGVDSSVVSALAAAMADRRVDTGDAERAWWPRLHSFSIGLEGSPDLAAAKTVADHIGTVHHGFTFTVQEGLDALRDVIWHVETFDTTTIRASTPMYLLARRIKAMGVKMVLSGEGSDEAFAGYLYFHKAPGPRDLHEECVRKLLDLHLYDCARANKAMSAFGVEARVPFLDRDVLDTVMRVPPHQKLCRDGRIEKHLLREAFDGLIPDRILWRQKEQFSDGVGYGWIDTLKRIADERVSDGQLARAGQRFPVSTPLSKEAYLYREIFDELFPLPSAAATVPSAKSVACSSEVALAWDKAWKDAEDPSGRAVAGVHDDAY